MFSPGPKQTTSIKRYILKHETLFDGVLKTFPGQPMHIDLIPGATPVYRRPYPVPQVHLQTFKNELYHLVDIGVLSPVRDTEWGLLTFITPKKDGTVRGASDLRELNKVVKKTQYCTDHNSSRQIFFYSISEAETFCIHFYG